MSDIHGRSISLADYTSQKIRHTPRFKAPKTYQNAFGSQAATYQKPVYTPQTAYQASQSYGGYAAQTMYSPLAKAQANGQSTYNWGQSTSREAKHIHRNWIKALEETITHVCDPKTMKGQDKGNKRLSKTELGQFIRTVHEGDLKAVNQLMQQHQFAPKYKGYPEEGAKAASLLFAFLVGLVTKNPKATMVAYGGSKAGLISLARGDNWKKSLLKTGIGALTGYSIGQLTASIGAKGLVSESLTNGISEGVLETFVDGLNGDEITVAKLQSSIVNNIGGNLLLGIGGKAIGKGIGKLNQPAKIKLLDYSKNLETLADDTASQLSGEVTQLKNGYKVDVPNGKKSITVRIMNSGSGGRTKPYVRVSIDGKGSLNLDGNLSTDRSLTHIDLSSESLKQIRDMISKYKGE